MKRYHGHTLLYLHETIELGSGRSDRLTGVFGDVYHPMMEALGARLFGIWETTPFNGHWPQVTIIWEIDAFADYRTAGVDRVVCEEKHMGSRAVVLVCRDAASAAWWAPGRSARGGRRSASYLAAYTTVSRSSNSETVIRPSARAWWSWAAARSRSASEILSPGGSGGVLTTAG